MARISKKSGEQKPKRFRRTRRVIKWIFITLMTLIALAIAAFLFLASQVEDGSEPNPKPTPTKQYMVDEKESWQDADMPAPTQETGDEKGEEVSVDTNVWQ
jgi:flagellar basal body-associated protein FliL